MCKEQTIKNLCTSGISNDLEGSAINELKIITLAAPSEEVEKNSSASASPHDTVVDGPVPVDNNLPDSKINLETNLTSGTLEKTSSNNTLTPNLQQLMSKKRKIDTKCISVLADGVKRYVKCIISI